MHKDKLYFPRDQEYGKENFMNKTAISGVSKETRVSTVTGSCHVRENRDSSVLPSVLQKGSRKVFLDMCSGVWDHQYCPLSPLYYYRKCDRFP